MSTERDRTASGTSGSGSPVRGRSGATGRSGADDPAHADDPFGTAELRAATLDAWRRSPTRLREDAAAEADLRRGGYRDRVLTELAQNAADAAAAAGAPGTLTVTVEPDSGEVALLRVANTGAPLDRDGVVTLCALRASTKTGGVGRFGVGFTAVTALGDDAAIRSSLGGVAFSGARTRRAVAQAGLRAPDEGPPVLRLPWPEMTPPAAGADTEVIVRLRGDVDTAALAESMCAEAPELLLELPALTTIRIGDRSFTRRDEDRGPSARMLRIGATDGTETAWLEVSAPGTRWLARMDGDRVVPAGPDVVRAPTRSDEELSLPALLIADVPMAPDRRRLMPEATLGGCAETYPELMRAVDPDERLRLVPAAGFPLGPVDAQLREDITAALRSRPWLPTVQDRDVGGRDALVVENLTPELADVLGGTVDALLTPAFSDARARALVAPFGVRIVDAAELAEMLSGIDRPPEWWHRLYSALEPLTADSAVLDRLGALPVPLADGRTVTGPRTTVVGDGLGAEQLHGRSQGSGAESAGAGSLGANSADAGSTGADSASLRAVGTVPVLPWVRLVHPAASHDLLVRLGAARLGAEDLLADPALRTAVEEALDAVLDGGDPAPDAPGVAGAGSLAAAVLTLVGGIVETHDAPLPEWLGMLPLPDRHGELRPADELLAPGAPLGDLLVDDAPFGMLDASVVESFGIDALRAVGVGWGFGLVREESPTAPDHDLDDETDWWARLDEEPATLVAVRDLDLVDPDRWGEALPQLVADERIRPLLADRAGYTAWWLRRHARIGGVPLGAFRGEDTSFAGLLDPFPGEEAAILAGGVLAGDRVDGPEIAAVLLERLADPARTPSPAVIARAHERLAEAVDGGSVDLDDLGVPDSVRAIDGSVVAAERALVLDRPWLAAAVPEGRLVVGSLRGADALADLLDVEVASRAVQGTVTSPGRRTAWEDEPAAVVAAVQRGERVPAGAVVVHDDGVTVRIVEDGEEPRDVPVPWWVDGDGVTHTDGRWGRPVRRGL